jgi:formylglycine-generating enzyme required for sulfatase activity
MLQRPVPSAVLPAPFEWSAIPSGLVTLTAEENWQPGYSPAGSPQTVHVPCFHISRYPITNAQFARFIEAEGYQQSRWWSDVGWELCELNHWRAPYYWLDTYWNDAELPVVGVTWYEAAAFCRWLSEASGHIISLPTDAQWQHAAQGETTHVYPWGDTWNPDCCNTLESSIGKTTPVTRYAGIGDSSFGVTDLIGNVWEWCVTEYRTGYTLLEGTGSRVLHGGSWNDSKSTVHIAYRGCAFPDQTNNTFGFRVVWQSPG